MIIITKEFIQFSKGNTFDSSIFPRVERGVVATFVSSFIGLSFEGMSSYLHYKSQKAFGGLGKNVDLARNKTVGFENSMII